MGARSRRIWRTLDVVAVATVAGLIVLGSLASYHQRQDSAELATIASGLVDPDASTHDQLRTLTRYVGVDVGGRSPDAYYLLPVFRILRPTANQIIELGGHCGDKSRTLVLLLEQLDIEASRRVLYYPWDNPLHAVVRAESNRGTYMIDALRGHVYENDDGSPMSQERIAVDYPAYQRMSTMRWNGNVVMRVLRPTLGLFMSEEAIDRIPRFSLFEKPAAMVAVASFSALPVPLLFLLSGRARRRRSRAEYEATIPPARTEESISRGRPTSTV